MDTLLESLLCQWDYINTLHYEQWQRMPEYHRIYREYHSFDKRISAALGPEYQQFDAAQGAYYSLSDRAALLTGAHVALRLLTSLL